MSDIKHELNTQTWIGKYLISVYSSGNVCVANESKVMSFNRILWDQIRDAVDLALVEHDRMQGKLDD